MQPNPSYQAVYGASSPHQQQPQPSLNARSPAGTPQLSSQSMEATNTKRTKRQYPRAQAHEFIAGNAGYSPEIRNSSYPQQQQHFQQRGSYYQAQQQPQQFIQPQPATFTAQPTLQHSAASPYQQQPMLSPITQQPQQGYITNGYNQMLNGMAQMSLNHSPVQQPMIRQDVPLVGQPPAIEHIHEELSAPAIPLNATATGSSFAQVHTKFNHSTVNAFPATNALLKKSKLPLGLIIQPFLSSISSMSSSDDKQQHREDVPVVPDTVVTRCSRCKTYINPFVQFTAGALKWQCNMCGLDNDIPQAFDWDIMTQQPADRYARPELNYGCVDFVAPSEYMVRPPQPPVYVFVIDTSFQAVQSGMIAVVADAILASLDKLPNEDGRTKVALMTVDSAVGFYKLSGQECELLVVGDLTDVYLPRAASDLCVNLVESRKAVEDMLIKMKTMFNGSSHAHTPSNCLGVALQAARKLLSPTGGKIVCFQASVPNIGDGAVKAKQESNKSILDSPMLSSTNTQFYKLFANECTKLQICADMFIFGGGQNQVADVATLNIIPRYTGGQTHYYPAFNAAVNPGECQRLKEEVMALLSEQIGLEAVMRTRCSTGIVCHAFYGNCTTRVPDIMALPNVPRDQSYAIDLVIEEDIQTPFVYFQTALLHTTCFGERRIRVMNLCLPVTKSISELYASVNQVALARLLCHQAMNKGANSKLSDGRDHLSKETVNIMGAYAKEVVGMNNVANSQLSICPSLSLLPLLILGILKTDAFQDAPVPTDMRSQSVILLRTLPTNSWLRLVHPRFYSLHNMPPNAGTAATTSNTEGQQQAGNVVMPPTMNLSSEKIEPYGCYMLEDGLHVYIWVGKQAVPQLCQDLLGASNVEEIKSGQVPTLPNIPSALSDRVRNIIQHIQRKRQTTYYPTIYIIREDGEPMLRNRFLGSLIEDRQPTGPTTAGANQQNVSSGMSYFQWLGYIRSKSQ
ncbi:hypothetical protein BDF20DRAFT_900917 [Mycotypha africana]|uniref:uncharacterized protein n=1 Tax=Mycotypha africana TaxID=64632 RepID=UPI002300C641|nr:uncharacterized protein BDF20DRAFT_900917 [Mycotypha africana]KAI8967408.1 hypothetical protein BDF20DRAFT_900917 [Mycotypha africana]